MEKYKYSTLLNFFMEIEEVIMKRRSIRRYISRSIDHEKIAKIIEVARFAPSAGNIQNWKVILISDDKKKKELAKAALDQHWMLEAPLYMVICNEYKKVSALYGKLGKMFSIQDCAVFATNAMLMATSLGLSTCWVGAFDNEAVKRVLGIPDGVDPEIILTIGYAGEEKLDEHKRKEASFITFFNSWGKRTGELFKKKPLKLLLKEKVNTILGKV